MSKLAVIIFIFSFWSLKAFSATKLLLPTDKLPRELIYLTESLQELQARDIEKTRDNDKQFKDLELRLQQISKEEIYFISKAEIYKTALAFKPPLNIDNKFYQKDVIVVVENRMKNEKLNSFSHWLLGSILKDVKDIFGSRDFPSFFTERNRGTIVTLKSKKIQKKLNFLLPWLQSFLNEETELFQYSLTPLMNKILSKISTKLDYLIAHSLFNKSVHDKEEPVAYFKLQTIELDKLGKPVTVEDILDPLLGKLRNNNLPVPVDDWVTNEDDFAQGLTPLKIQKPSGSYKAPAKLPTPAEEW